MGTNTDSNMTYIKNISRLGDISNVFLVIGEFRRKTNAEIIVDRIIRRNIMEIV